MRVNFRSGIAIAILASAIGAWASLRSAPPSSPPPPPLVVSEPVMAPAPKVDQAASIGAATIEVIVSRNDTLDRIFRRLQLNLADLALLRDLPGLKARLDQLRPGEALKLLHRDGALFGFERQLSP